MSKITITFIFIALWLNLSVVQGQVSGAVGLRPVPYRDVTSIVLDSGKMTLGRRSVVPQMNNVGRHYDASVLPTTMQCSNMGWDGSQFTWKCQAQMVNGVDLDRVDVMCEDWDPPVSDATINDVMTYGSCGVEYTLKGTPLISKPIPSPIYVPPNVHDHSFDDRIHAHHVNTPSHETYTTVTETVTTNHDHDVAIFFFWLLFICVIGWLFSQICCSGDSRRSSSTVHVSPSTPPPTVYVTDPTPSSTIHVSSAAPTYVPPVHVTVENRPSSSSYSSGYVDGMVTSSILRPSSWGWGSGWGSTSHVVHHNAPSPSYSRTTTTTTSSSPSPSYSSGSSSSSGGSSSGGTHTSSSFGGTKRR